MKKFFLLALLIFGSLSLGFSQTYIRTVVSKPQQVPPMFSGGASAADAVEIITEWVNLYAALNCSNKLSESMKPLIIKVQNKYRTLLKGKMAEFLVITDKQNCKALDIVQKTQAIRVKDGECSVEDIKLEAPTLIYDPISTGFFNIKIQF